MPGEKEPYCLLGNGICPTECRLYKNAAEITAAVEANGDQFDPVASRRMIIFADVSHDVNVVQIAAVMAKCRLESIKPQKPLVQ